MSAANDWRGGWGCGGAGQPADCACQRSFTRLIFHLTVGAPVPNDARFKGPFKPMRFEANRRRLHGDARRDPKDLCGGLYRVGPPGSAN